MSWQAYVDDHLMCEIDGNYLTSSAIVGHDGSVWAQSAAFPTVFLFPFLSPFFACNLGFRSPAGSVLFAPFSVNLSVFSWIDLSGLDYRSPKF